jgi:hypothetical protein
MAIIVINVLNVVGSPFCVQADDGDKIFALVKKALTEKRRIALSFLNVEMLTSAFLNTAIGQLYRDFTEEEIKMGLSVRDLSPSGLVALKRVVETAKLYYKYPDAMEQSIREITD